jgi:HSP20 family protein
MTAGKPSEVSISGGNASLSTKEKVMNNLSVYNPWNDQGNASRWELRQVLDRIFNPEQADQSNIVTSQWAPNVDICEEENRFLILADIPGVDPEDIEVTMENGILSIKGQRTDESIQQKGKVTRIERSHGTFYRRFALPDSADANGIKASGRHGVLEIAIPKRPESAPRRITVSH